MTLLDPNRAKHARFSSLGDVKRLKKPATLLMNTSFFPNIGGVESSLANLSLELSSTGRQVIVVAGDTHAKSDERLSSTDSLFGAKVYRYKYNIFPFYAIRCVRLLRRLKKQYDIELVISRSNVTTICCRIAGIRNIKHVPSSIYSLLNRPSLTGRSKIRSWASYALNSLIEYINLSSLKKTYVFSSELASQVLQINKNLTVAKVLPGVNRNRFRKINGQQKSKLREQLGLPLNKTLVLYVGRFDKVKNIETMIDVVVDLGELYELLLVGEGSYEPTLKEYVKSKRVEQSIRFLGSTQQPEHYYQAADLFLMTSFYESFGQTTLEALSCGLRVYGYKNGENVRVATEEILQIAGIADLESHLCLADEGAGGLVKRIKAHQREGDAALAFERSWLDFYDDLIRL